MSDLLNEQLSALLDGELPPEETALLLKRLEREPELAARLARYRLGGDVLRGDRARPRADFAMRVSAAIAAEPPLVPPLAPPLGRSAAPVEPRRRWWRPAGGLAVAAGVGALALLVLQQSPVLNPPAAQPVLALSAPALAPVLPVQHRSVASRPAALAVSAEPSSYVTPAAPPASSALSVIPEASLAHYVVAHSEVSSPMAGRSALIHLLVDPSSGDAPAQ